jgi:hypothetical protein
MNAAAAIRRAVPVLAQYGTTDPMILRARLIRAGLSKIDAVAAMRFVPLALGRAILLEGIGIALPDSYLMIHGEAREEKKLADEKFFAATKWLASTLGADYGVNTVGVVALLSAEVQAVNDALNAGAQPADLVASLPVVTWVDGVDDAPPRPWWKFWG